MMGFLWDPARSAMVGPFLRRKIYISRAKRDGRAILLRKFRAKENLWDFYGGVSMGFLTWKIKHDISMGGFSMGFERFENRTLWGGPCSRALMKGVGFVSAVKRKFSVNFFSSREIKRC